LKSALHSGFRGKRGPLVRFQRAELAAANVALRVETFGGVHRTLDVRRSMDWLWGAAGGFSDLPVFPAGSV
jgi:hypothetical protein